MSNNDGQISESLVEEPLTEPAGHNAFEEVNKLRHYPMTGKMYGDEDVKVNPPQQQPLINQQQFSRSQHNAPHQNADPTILPSQPKRKADFDELGFIHPQSLSLWEKYESAITGAVLCYIITLVVLFLRSA